MSPNCRHRFDLEGETEVNFWLILKWICVNTLSKHFGELYNNYKHFLRKKKVLSLIMCEISLIKVTLKLKNSVF